MSGLRVAELVVAGLFFAGGVRSFAYWVRRPIDSDAAIDQVWYSLYRTGRVGLWFAVGGIFLISGLTSTEGKAFHEDFAAHRWYLMVPPILAAMQLVGGYLVGRGADKRPGLPDPAVPPAEEAPPPDPRA